MPAGSSRTGPPPSRRCPGRLRWAFGAVVAFVGYVAFVAVALLAGSAAPAAGAAPEDIPRPERSAREIRETAEEVLARPELRPPVRSIQQRIVDFVVEQVERAISTVVGGGRGALLGWLIVVAALGVLTFFVVRFLQGTGRGDRRLGVHDQDRRRPAAEWRAEAAAHEARGEWRQALRCRYRALVADLAAVGLVEEVAGRTAGEYRAEVAGSLPDAAVAFGSATDLFERAWYGARRTGEAHNRRFLALAAEVMDRAGGSAPERRRPDAGERAGVGARAGGAT